MSAALATLPWVEIDSIKADRNSRQVRFAVTKKELFDEKAVIELLSEKGYSGSKLITGLNDLPPETPAKP